MADYLGPDKVLGDQHSHTDFNAMKSAINSKVDKVTGKQLSTEDYSTIEKSKLGSIASNATVYNDTMADARIALQKGAVNGVGSLDASGKLLVSQVPNIAIVQYLGSVATQAAMLALVGQSGDWTIRTDQNKVYIITGPDPTQLANWTPIAYPATGGVGWGGITGLISDQTDLATALNSKAPLNAPAFTGAPTLVTAPAAADNSSKIPTTAWFQTEFTNNQFVWNNTYFGGLGNSGSPMVLNPIPVAWLSASGVKDNTTVLYGDNVFRVPPSGGGGGGAWTRVAQGTFANDATKMIDFSAYKTTHKKFQLLLISVKTQTSTQPLKMRFSSDGTNALTAANYRNLRGEETVFINPQGTTTEAPVTEMIAFPNIDIGAGKYVEAYFEFSDINNAAKFPKVAGWASGFVATVGPATHRLTQHYEVASTFLGIQFYCGSGNIVSGEWHLLAMAN